MSGSLLPPQPQLQPQPASDAASTSSSSNAALPDVTAFSLLARRSLTDSLDKVGLLYLLLHLVRFALISMASNRSASSFR